MMYRIAIVEDDQNDQDALKKHLVSFQKETGSEFLLSSFTNGMDFLESFHSDYDIVFLDIEMPFIDGMKVAERIRKQDEEVLLIFTTNLSNYALSGYMVNALGFLVKPVRYSLFQIVIKKAVQILNREEKRYMVISSEGNQKRIVIQDIAYCEVLDHYVFFHTRDNIYKVHMKISDAEKILLSKENSFIKVHRSYIVNPKDIEEIKANSLLLFQEKKEIPISRNKKKEIMEKILSYNE